MKLSGLSALYAQRKELETALSVTDKQIALAEELEAPKPEKKARKKRTPKVNGADIPPLRDAYEEGKKALHEA